MNANSETDNRVTHSHLDNHVLGFFEDEQAREVFQSLLDMQIEEEAIIFVPAEDASEVVDAKGTRSGPLIWAERLLQRIIGGGPAELIRDVQMDYGPDTMFLCVRVSGEKQKNEVGELMKRHGGRKVKFINHFYVEHITVEPDHDQMRNVPVEDTRTTEGSFNDSRS